MCERTTSIHSKGQQTTCSRGEFLPYQSFSWKRTSPFDDSVGPFDDSARSDFVFDNSNTIIFIYHYLLHGTKGLLQMRAGYEHQYPPKQICCSKKSLLQSSSVQILGKDVLLCSNIDTHSSGLLSCKPLLNSPGLT